MSDYTLRQILEESHFFDPTGKRMLQTDALHKLNALKAEIELLKVLLLDSCCHSHGESSVVGCNWCDSVLEIFKGASDE